MVGDLSLAGWVPAVPVARDSRDAAAELLCFVRVEINVSGGSDLSCRVVWN